MSKSRVSISIRFDAELLKKLRHLAVEKATAERRYYTYGDLIREAVERAYTPRREVL